MKLRENIVIILMTAVSLGIGLFFFLLSPVSDRPQYGSAEIGSGDSFRDIAKLLYEKGAIRSPRVFMIYGVISGSAHQLKPGNYSLSSGSTTPAIIKALVLGPTIDREIVFPEGVTVKDIDAMLDRAGILPAGTILKFPAKSLAGKYEFLANTRSFEGYLFPDTYRFFLNTNVEQVVKKFLDNFEKKGQSLLKECQMSNVKCQMLEAKQILIIASLLEKEAPEFRDRQIIAGIIYKRLKLGIPLQVDATITYAKCDGAFSTCKDPKVYRRDLEFQSRYNTYLYNGLPPGPIGNPGLEAIKAALNPISSEYLYYLSDPKTKKTIFSKTLDEHNDKRVIYLSD